MTEYGHPNESESESLAIDSFEDDCDIHADSENEIEATFYENPWLLTQLEDSQLLLPIEPKASSEGYFQPLSEYNNFSEANSDLSTDISEEAIPKHVASFPLNNSTESNDQDKKDDCAISADEWGTIHYQIDDSQEYPSQYNKAEIAGVCTGLERYWYSDEDLPPLDNVYTIDSLASDPSLRHMYEFFKCKLLN